MRCAVCNHPKANEILAKLYDEKITLEDAARELGVSPKTLWRHLKYHVTDSDVVDREIDPLKLLEELTLLLKERLDALKGTKKGVYVHERMIAMLVREIRETLMDIEKLSGRLQAAPLIQLQQINVQYEKLLAFITTELCEECRKKVIRFLET